MMTLQEMPFDQFMGGITDLLDGVQPGGNKTEPHKMTFQKRPRILRPCSECGTPTRFKRCWPCEKRNSRRFARKRRTAA